MFKVEIKKDSVLSNLAIFETEAQCTSWVTENHDAFPEGYAAEITNISALKAQEKEAAEAQAYLNSTDWYVIRNLETGVVIPNEVSTKRAEARLKNIGVSMNTSELLAKIPDFIQIAALVLPTITVAATVVVRLTPTKSDDAYVSKGAKMLVKVLRWLPTIGINPQTKKLEETIMELREQTQPGVDVKPT